MKLCMTKCKEESKSESWEKDKGTEFKEQKRLHKKEIRNGCLEVLPKL